MTATTLDKSVKWPAGRRALMIAAFFRDVAL